MKSPYDKEPCTFFFFKGAMENQCIACRGRAHCHSLPSLMR